MTASAGVSGLNVWSESPTGILGNAFWSASIMRRCASRCFVGYASTHWRRIILSLPNDLMYFTDSRISATDDAPVERMIGFLVFAIFRSIGKNVMSEEEILYAGTPIRSRKSTESRSKGVEKSTMPIFFAYRI